MIGRSFAFSVLDFTALAPTVDSRRDGDRSVLRVDEGKLTRDVIGSGM